MSEPRIDLRTPVLLINYRRPTLTRGLINRLRRSAPEVVYFFADGPKTIQDVRSTDAVRRCVAEIDWVCELFTFFPEANLGCKDGVISAIDWVLKNEDRVVVLEDDCFPAPDFLPFCSALLEMYKYDDQVAMVSGTNDISNELKNLDNCPDFVFDTFGSTWGWATWERAWNGIDRDVSSLSDPRKVLRFQALQTQYPALAGPILSGFQSVAEGSLDTWDFQWAMTRLLAGQMTIVPRTNLVVNRGFGPHATHTKSRAWGIPRTTSALNVARVRHRRVESDTWFTEMLECRAIKATSARHKARARKARLRILTLAIMKRLMSHNMRRRLWGFIKGFR